MAVLLRKALDTVDKLEVLSRDSRYDLACACATRRDEHRVRSAQGSWIYPVALPEGGTTFLLKTLLSNACVNDCGYCPLRKGSASRPCALTPEETVRIFSAYFRAGRVSGLFLSSAVTGTPDQTMEQINRTARLLRDARFRGYIHLKVIPGASEAAVRQALGLATTVSVNVEAPGAEHFRCLTSTKNYAGVQATISLISRLTAPGAPFAGVKKTTQFVVGAARETDHDIIQASWDLYRKSRFNRVYFSAYQRGAGEPSLPGEREPGPGDRLLTREHRLYQVDWLLRKYGFEAGEIPFDSDGNLALEADPKEIWARHHPDFFPVDVNTDSRERLLRVPGLGHVTVERLLEGRRNGVRWRSLQDLGRRTALLAKAAAYVTF